MTSMGRLIGTWAAFALLVGGCTPGGSSRPTTGERVITFWQPFDSNLTPSLEKLVAAFEREHPGVRVRMSFASNNLTSSQKLFLAVAGGVGPDVCFVDGQQLAEWAARGAMTDLTEATAQAGLRAEDFWGPRWRESTFRDRVYAIPWSADPNFAFVWNKDLFRQAGLDPEKAPRTIDDLDEANRRLTKRSANGGLVNVGLVPWQWGGSNSLFTWGYAFGGNFYEEPSEKFPVGQVTADNPGVVRALTWMATFAKKYDVRKVNAYNSQFVGVSNNPFYLGKQGMSVLHVTQLKDLKKYAPTVDYGIGLIPAPLDGEYPTGWIGGWSLGIPRGKKPSADAMEFVRWMCTSDQATEIMAKEMDAFPAYRRSPAFERIKADPERRVFYEILQNSKHVRTLMPVQGYFMNLLQRASDNVLYGGADPKTALAEASAKAQERLEGVISAVDQREGGR
ncbi:MAG: ABC transporter substrate-binding protein [Fimbriimonas sp.]